MAPGRPTMAFRGSRGRHPLPSPPGSPVPRLLVLAREASAHPVRLGRAGPVGAQFGHSRGSRGYSDDPEMPVPLSAPGPTRTGDPQVRSLRTVLTQAI